MSLAPLLLLLSGLYLGLGLPLWLGRVPPNRWYGFRTPRTQTNPGLWYTTNAIGGRDLSVAGGIIALAALLSWLLPAAGPLIGGVAFTGATAGAVLHTMFAASAAAARLDGAERAVPQRSAERKRQPLPPRQRQP